VPAGLAQHAWYYFAIFAGVVAALVAEPLPNPAVGLIGITTVAVLGRYVLQSQADLAKPGFNPASDAVNWALSGFASNTVWLVGAAFIKWFADYVAHNIGGYDPTLMIMLLVTIYFLSHCMFASLTAHTSAMFPVMLGVGMGIQGMPAGKLAFALALTPGSWG
jgi:di/tricarboxylate transporter